MKLITNNPKFINFKEKNIIVEYNETDYLTILNVVRDYIHKNYSLQTHPLYGSVKPNETIYRTILLKKEEFLDYNSVILISDAIITFEKFKKNKVTPIWSDRVKDDFSVIDHDLITNAITRIL